MEEGADCFPGIRQLNRTYLGEKLEDDHRASIGSFCFLLPGGLLFIYSSLTAISVVVLPGLNESSHEHAKISTVA